LEDLLKNKLLKNKLLRSRHLIEGTIYKKPIKNLKRVCVPFENKRYRIDMKKMKWARSSRKTKTRL